MSNEIKFLKVESCWINPAHIQWVENYTDCLRIKLAGKEDTLCVLHRGDVEKLRSWLAEREIPLNSTARRFAKLAGNGGPTVDFVQLDE